MKRSKKSIVIATWKHGYKATHKAYNMLNNNGFALDAVEAGVRVTESDSDIRTVGYGGYTDQDGNVTLDASIMDHLGNAGSVAYLKEIKHPISVARRIMEKSSHVMLVGDGAQKFALQNGFKKENILYNQSKEDWLEWKKNKNALNNLISEDNHDTITLLAQDKKGNFAAACSTSGLRYKLNGRVGDSSIIGSGIYVDNEIGAAGATGQGEEIMKSVGSFLILELMKKGYHPQHACEEANHRIIKKYTKIDFQVAYIALRADGEKGASAINNGFSYILAQNSKTTIHSIKGII
jgi:isoaspartyl peptidase/L-asparaginase-like protein (Ntn-hydrolase superfamily)